MRQAVHHPLRIVLAVSILVALAFGGCEKEKPAPAPVVKKTMPKEAAKAAEAAQPAAVTVAKPPPVSFYNPAGKRDPFVTFLKVREKETGPALGSLPPLQSYDLGEFRLVGIIWGLKAPRALVEDSGGKGYAVTIGTKIGRSGGVVTRITEKEIIVREEFRDYTGSKVKRDTSLKLQDVGGK